MLLHRKWANKLDKACCYGRGGGVGLACMEHELNYLRLVLHNQGDVEFLVSCCIMAGNITALYSHILLCEKAYVLV